MNPELPLIFVLPPGASADQVTAPLPVGHLEPPAQAPLALQLRLSASKQPQEGKVTSPGRAQSRETHLLGFLLG